MTDSTRLASPARAAAARRGAARARTAQETIAADIAMTLSAIDAQDDIRGQVIARACEGETLAALALLGYW